MAPFLTNDRRIDKDHLNDLRYLEQCILETLRMYSEVTFVGRRTHKDVVLKGILHLDLIFLSIYYNSVSGVFTNCF